MLNRFRVLALSVSLCLGLAGPVMAQVTTDLSLPDAVRSARFVPNERSREYEPLIQEHARNNGIRLDLVRAVIQVESNFNPSAVSPKGAVGLMQLMPATIQDFGVRNPFDPRENVRAGVAYLRRLLDRYSNNEELALAAYNAGPGAVDAHGETIPPFRETQQYVSRVSGLAGPRVATKLPGSSLYRIVQVIDGQEYKIYSNDPNARINLAALRPADPDAHTQAQTLRSASIFQAP